MELWILAAFSAALIACLAAGKSLIFALLAGFILFFSHGLKTGHSFSEMVHLALSGIKTTKNVLITLSLVGMLTAAWRISGTIPYIVYHASQWCDGSAVLLASFLLCALVSALTGTSFGTAATIGVICMTIANSMNIPPMYSGGAIMAGSYFGDRCSPMSTSALLVAAITKTDIFTNCRLMVKTAVVPSILTCVIYASMGILFQGSSTSSNAAELFCRSFNLSWITLVPAALVIILSARRIDVKAIMITSTIAAAIIASEIQHMPLSEIFASCLLGFHPADPDLARLASGGGIVSMADVVAIICISIYHNLYDLLQSNLSHHADAPALPVCRTRPAAPSHSSGKYGHHHFSPYSLVNRLLGLFGDYRRAPRLGSPSLLLIFHSPLELPNLPPETITPSVQ